MTTPKNVERKPRVRATNHSCTDLLCLHPSHLISRDEFRTSLEMAGTGAAVTGVDWARGWFQFGDIVKTRVGWPDPRRWMVIQTAGMGRPWALLYLGPNRTMADRGFSVWKSMAGFMRADG